jgi:hypothetical protein
VVADGCGDACVLAPYVAFPDAPIRCSDGALCKATVLAYAYVRAEREDMVRMQRAKNRNTSMSISKT